MSDIGDGNVVITQRLFDKMCRIADMSKINNAASEELRKLLSGAPWTAADAAILAACRKAFTAHDFFNRK